MVIMAVKSFQGGKCLLYLQSNIGAGDTFFIEPQTKCCDPLLGRTINKSGGVRGTVLHLSNYAYMLSCREFDAKINTSVE